MSFSNPVAKSVGADGTAPGRVWESRLLPALITPNIVVGGVLCVPVGAPAPHPLFLFVVVLLHRVVRGVLQKGCWGLCVGETLEGFRIDWCFRRGLYESEGGVACQHLVLWNSRADFPCQ